MIIIFFIIFSPYNKLTCGSVYRSKFDIYLDHLLKLIISNKDNPLNKNFISLFSSVCKV